MDCHVVKLSKMALQLLANSLLYKTLKSMGDLRIDLKTIID